MVDLTKIFNKVVKGPKREHKEKPPSIKPSSLGTPCYRKLYYSYNNVEPDFEFELKNLRIMKLGTAAGEMLIEEFRKAEDIKVVDYYNEDGSTPKYGGGESKEFPLSAPELSIKLAFIDMVFIQDGKLYLGEFKTCNDDKYKSLKDIDLNHKYQIFPYFYIFNKLLKEGKFSHIKELEGFTEAEGMVVLYLNKNTSYMKQFQMQKDDQFFLHIIQKINAVKAFTEAKQLPPKTPDWCGSCQYRTKCQENRLK